MYIPKGCLNCAVYCVIQQTIPNTLVILSPFFTCGRNRRHTDASKSLRKERILSADSHRAVKIFLFTLNVAVRAVSLFVSLLTASYTSLLYFALPLFELFNGANGSTFEISSLSNSLSHLCCRCLYTEMSDECRNHSYFIDALIRHVLY